MQRMGRKCSLTNCTVVYYNYSTRDSSHSLIVNANKSFTKLINANLPLLKLPKLLKGSKKIFNLLGPKLRQPPCAENTHLLYINNVVDEDNL